MLNRRLNKRIREQENPIVATVSVDGLRTILSRQFSPLQFSDRGVEAIASGIEQELGTGIMPLAVHLTDYVDRSEFTGNGNRFFID